MVTTSSTLDRKIHINPIIGDTITFLKKSKETNGTTTLAELTLVPFGKGTPPHYHDRLTEIFTVLDGELTVKLNDETKVLTSGQSITVPIGSKHCFYNAKNRPVKALVEFQLGSEGAEKAIIIAYGLARDGHCDKNGLPKRLDYMALLFDMGEGRVPGILSLMMPVLRFIARRARKKGIEAELIKKYVLQ